MVFQDAFLFAGTLRDNITMDSLLSDQEVWEALRVAALDEFVRSLPEGLNTEIGERGVSLSGGQRQRVALARAIARRASLLVMDDTTSALDPVTETLVLKNLTGLEPRRTIVIVATRPSAVALAEHVLFVAEGKLRDSGAPQDLLARNTAYRELIASYAADRRSHSDTQQDPQ
jgi:ABC-type multidrug transport system fused ATPase/permease subunit